MWKDNMSKKLHQQNGDFEKIIFTQGNGYKKLHVTIASAFVRV